MNVTTIVLGLCLLCLITHPVQKSEPSRPQGVKNFCEVMKDPKLVQDKSIRLAAGAQVFPGGILLKSDACQPDVSVHFKDGYERESSAQALASLQSFQRRAYESQFSGADMNARDAIVQIVFEGMLTKNPGYHLEFARGAATLAAWDYQQEYAFVVARVISIESKSH